MRVQMILEAIDRASRPIRAVAESLLGVERAAKATRGIGKIGQGLYSLGGRVAGIAAISGTAAAGLAVSMLDTASAFETMEATLTTTEGSQAKARAAMSWVSDFAAKTPYELQQVNDAFIALRSYGLNPTNGMLKTLGDTSSAMGKPLMQAVEAMADAVVGENERLKEFGIRASVSKKTDEVTYSYTDLAGKIHEVTAKLSDQADIAAKLSTIFNSRFGGAMEQKASTWVNIVANLKDAWTRFQLTIMSSGLFDWMRSKAQALLTTVNQMAADGRLQQLATEIGQSIQKILQFAWDLGVGIVEAIRTIAPYVEAIVNFVGGARNALMLLGGLTVLRPILMIGHGIVLLIGALSPLAPILMIAARAFMAFGMAIMATPVGWIIGAIALIAGGAYLIYQNWERIGPMLSLIWNALAAGMRMAWEGMIAWLAGIGARILVAIKSGWASVTGWLSGLGSEIVNALSTAWASVTGWFSGISWPSLPPFVSLDTAKRGLDVIGADITGRLTSGWASVTGWFSGLSWPSFPTFGSLDGVKAMLGTMGTDITGKLASAWASVTAWFATMTWPTLPPFTFLADIQAALEPVLKWVEEWGGRLLNVFTGAIDKVTDFIGGAATTIGNTFNKVTNALSWGAGDTAAPSAASVAASAADIEKTSAAAKAATDTINAIPAAAAAAVGAAKAIFAGVSFHSHGVAMMETLATGIRAGAASAVAAARATVQQIRDYLPHSPAKTGPLSDLDRVQFSQTLATAINAGAPRAVMAVRALAAGMAASMPASHAYALDGAAGPARAPAPAVFARARDVSGASKSVSGGSSISVSLTLSPNFAGTGGGDFIEQLRAALPNIGYELAQTIKAEMDRNERTQH